MSYSVLKTQHTSLQFSDTKLQQEQDVEQLFKRGKDFPLKTGTEAGPETFSRKKLVEMANDYGHAIHFSRASWVAIDRAIIKKGSIRKGEVFVADNSRLVGKMHDRAFPFISFTHVDDRLGRISQATTHYPTKGRLPKDPNNDINRLYAEKLSEWMKKQSRGTAISFNNGDFNMPDNHLDWSFGKGFTSMGDELRKYPNTGHGPIDGFCSFNKDGRVKARKLVVLDDSEMKMNSDHFVVRGWWVVRHLKQK